MATTIGINAFSGATCKDLESSAMPPKPPDPPDILDPSSLPDSTQSNGKGNGTSNGNVKKLRFIHVENLPATCNYETVFTSLSAYGNILEIRMNLVETQMKWEAWVSFINYEYAFNASCSRGNLLICESHVRGTFADKVPVNLDKYKPSEWNYSLSHQSPTGEENLC